MEKRNLRKGLLASGTFHVNDLGVVAHDAEGFEALCDMIWQGDFGKGQPTGSGIFSDPGINPCVAYGPVPATGVSGQGLTFPPYRLGMIAQGDFGAEFVLCKLVLAALTDLLPGQAYQWDKDFTLTLLTTANSVLNEEVGWAQIWAPQLAIGTYYVWVQRAGHMAVIAAAASVATGAAETTATAGQVKLPAAPTAATKSIGPATGFGASSSITFTGNTVNGSPTINNVVSASGLAADPLRDITLGMVITGANLPANSIVSAIRKVGNTWAIDIGTNTGGSYATLQNATGTAVGTVFTVTSHVVANVYWPTLNKQN